MMMCGSENTIAGAGGGSVRSTAPPMLTSTTCPARTVRPAILTRVLSTNTPPSSITARALRRERPGTRLGTT
jgi:hypothetical protein